MVSDGTKLGHMEPAPKDSDTKRTQWCESLRGSGSTVIFVERQWRRHLAHWGEWGLITCAKHCRPQRSNSRRTSQEGFSRYLSGVTQCVTMPHRTDICPLPRHLQVPFCWWLYEFFLFQIHRILALLYNKEILIFFKYITAPVLWVAFLPGWLFLCLVRAFQFYKNLVIQYQMVSHENKHISNITQSNWVALKYFGANMYVHAGK